MEDRGLRIENSNPPTFYSLFSIFYPVFNTENYFWTVI